MPTIIGDIHGYHDKYLKIVQKSEYTIQVGDFGFDWSVLNDIDPNNHKIIGGNHDNYDIVENFPHYLGDYGTANVDGLDFFYIRGERSVDAHLRIEGRSWWRNEELDMTQGYAAVEAYINAKPEIVISHGCPASVIPLVCTNHTKQYSPSRTSQMLDAMFNNHRPKLWIFGHHHNSKTIETDGTKFICLDELETLNTF